MNLKKHALAVMLSATLPGLVMAEETISGFDGFVSAGYGRNSMKADGSSSVTENIGDLRFSGAYTSPSGFGGQIDNVYTKQKLVSQLNVGITDFAGHIYFRNTDFLIGVIGQRRTFDFSVSTGDASADLSADASLDLIISDRTFLGLEGQAYFGDLTIAAQGGQQKLTSAVSKASTGSNPSGSFANVQARYFLDENWRLDGTYSYGKVDFVDSAIKSNGIGLATEYRFSDSPFSVFARYDYLDSSANSTSFKNNRAMLGVKFNFGKESLKQRDRSGASLNPVPADNSIMAIANGFSG